MNPNPLAIPLISPGTVASQPTVRVDSSDGSLEACDQDTPVWRPGCHCPELDGVRGIAILLVTVYRFMKEWDPSQHWVLGISETYREFGQRGVDLFFVLSGFLITGILLQTKSSPGYFKNFMARRALRIFPLYFASLAVCLFFLPQALSTNIFELPRSNQLFLWTYTSNIYMAWTNAWCFGPLDHFWSLAVEEHFYLVWPVIVLCLSPKALIRFSLVMVFVVGIARAAVALRPEYDLAVDTLTLFRCDALMLGAVLAAAMKQRASSEKIIAVSKHLLPVLFLAYLAVVFAGSRWLGLTHTLSGLFWVALLAVAVTRSRSHWMSRQLRSPWLQWLGKYSYGMYVVQLPLVSLLPLSWIVLQMPWLASSTLFVSVAYVIALLAITAALAFASYHLLEKPFLNMKRFF
jgi:peptidoglycan/LPS O-acetylase OafA/YrhL